MRSWPSEFHAKKRGVNCPQCSEGRAESNEHGVRYFEGVVADAYLQWQAPTRGYSVVVFRSRRVGEAHSMTTEEHALLWTEVSRVARAIDRVHRPIHLNFQILGNQDPHVHVHIIPRYDPDPAPWQPLPAVVWETGHRLGAAEMRDAVAALRSVMS